MESKINLSFYTSSTGESISLGYVLYPNTVGGGYAGKNINEAVIKASKLLKKHPVDKVTLESKTRDGAKYWRFTEKELKKFKKLLEERIPNITFNLAT